NLAGLPAGDREAVARALSKSPDDRFPRCLDLVRALSGNPATESVPARPAPQDADQASRLTASKTAEETPACSTAQARESDLIDTPTRSLSAAPSTENRRWIRVHELAEPKAKDQPGPAVLAPQVHPDGVLFPALVIGAGQTGLAVLQRLRETIRQGFG